MNTETPHDLAAYKALLRWTARRMPVVAVQSPRWACGGDGRDAVRRPLSEHANLREAQLTDIAASLGVTSVSLLRAMRAHPTFPHVETSFMHDCN